MVMFYTSETESLRGHFLFLFWAFLNHTQHYTVCLIFVPEPEPGQIQCLLRAVSVVSDTHVEALSSIHWSVFLFWPLCLTVHYQFSKLAVFNHSHLPDELFLLVNFPWVSSVLAEQEGRMSFSEIITCCESMFPDTKAFWFYQSIRDFLLGVKQTNPNKIRALEVLTF